MGTVNLLDFSCGISRQDAVSIRETLCDHRSRADGGVGAKGDARQDHRVHPQPALLPKDDIFSGKMAVNVGRVVVSGDQAHSWGDGAAFSDYNFPVNALEIASRSPKVLHIVRIKNNILRRADVYPGRYGPGYMAVLS